MAIVQKLRSYRFIGRIARRAPIRLIKSFFFSCIVIILCIWILSYVNQFIPTELLDRLMKSNNGVNNRGFNQHIITVSFFGPKENALFQHNTSLNFLKSTIEDIYNVYPGWNLRVFHDNTIEKKHLEELKYRYDRVDFFNMSGRSIPPPRMWRFLPIGDAKVDVMISRDLDSPLTFRERAAVDDWLLSGKIIHIMRDHPYHFDFILAGMWGFRPALNRTLSSLIYDKLQNETIMQNYTGKGDQPFLLKELWPLVKDSAIVHDSFHCELYVNNSIPFPTKRPEISGKNIFVGCVKPCADNQFTFGECPTACRPKDHQDWISC